MRMRNMARCALSSLLTISMAVGMVPAKVFADEVVVDELAMEDVVPQDENAQDRVAQDDVTFMPEPSDDALEVTSPEEAAEAPATEQSTSGEASDGRQEASLTTQAAAAPKVSGRSKAEGRKWTGRRRGAKLKLGATGKRLKLEAFRLYRPAGGASGSIEYCAHVQNRGWMGWRRDGKVAGTVGRGLRLEAVRVRLTGELKEAYDVWYRVHAEGFGWLAWARNGKAAGSQGYARRVDAIQVGLAERGAGCPWANGKVGIAFVKGKGIYKAGLKKVSGDVQLDMMLDEFVKTRCGTGKGALRKAYTIISNELPYRANDTNPSAKDNWKKWSIAYAKDMYTTGSGNCYRRAALVCWVARYLGYDAKTVVGGVYQYGHVLTSHGWLEVKKNGTLYIIDPDMYRAYQPRNFFMVTYDEAPTEYVKY